jgi:hypothetical protein
LREPFLSLLVSGGFVTVKVLTWGCIIDYLDFFGIDLVYFNQIPGFIAFIGFAYSELFFLECDSWFEKCRFGLK